MASEAVPRLMYRLDECPQILGIGRTKVFEAIKSGQLETVMYGRRRLVTAAALEAFVRGLRPAPAAVVHDQAG